MYHPLMRHLVLVLMLALLPLRGWVGEVMAAQMATASPSQPGQAHTAAPAPQADCAGHGADDTAADGAEHNGTCTACDICHAVAVTTTAPKLAAALLPAALPQAATFRFASAERTPGFKPPIS